MTVGAILIDQLIRSNWIGLDSSVDWLKLKFPGLDWLYWIDHIGLSGIGLDWI